MAKPHSQTGYGPSSGAADESALPDGETSRRGSDSGSDTPKADWGASDATDDSSVSRVLGVVLVLVLAGVFSFVAYKKYNEARLHPPADTTVAVANTNPSAPGSDQAATADSKTLETNTAGATTAAANTSAFQQLDEPANSNAAFHPTAGEVPAGQPAATATAGRPARSPQTASTEADVNPFNDVATSTPPSNEPGQQGAQPETNRRHAAVPKPVASNEPRNDQSEPLFNESAGPQGTLQSGQPAGMARTTNVGPNPNTGNDPTTPKTAGPPARPIDVQQQPVQTAQSEQNAATKQGPQPAGAASQSEPLPQNDLLNESPRTTDVARNDQQPKPHNSAPGQAKASAGGLLDQEEPAPTSSPSEPVATAPTSSAAVPFSPRTPAQTAQASSTTTVHTSPAQTTAPDSEYLFAGKRSDATSGSGPAPISQRKSPVSIVGDAGNEATLNDVGDVYIVRPQDTFWTISRKKYGTARYFMALAELNKAHVPDPTRMRPGVKVSTPATEILETRFAQYLPKGSGVEVTSGERQAAKPAPAGFFVSADGKPVYRTGEKDTLSDIAARHLGRASRWIQIFEMNRDKLSSPNQVKVGTELALPTDASNVAVTDDNEERR